LGAPCIGGLRFDFGAIYEVIVAYESSFC
jgi:hypothetical protein